MTVSRLLNVDVPRTGPPFHVNDRAVPSTIGPLTLSDFVRYAGASGDFNAVHHDLDLARRLGHPDVFAMGMLPGALLAEFAASWMAPMRIRSLRLRFLDRVWNGEVLTLDGEVVEVNGEPEPLVRSRLWIGTPANPMKISAECAASST